jgi:tartrate-resistant acid phosphatase type 5
VTAEIEYTQLSQRWTFPARWHNQTFDIPGTNKTLLFLFIDTIIWAGPLSEDDPHGKPIGPEFHEGGFHYEEQKKWVENQLATTTADWIVMQGHFPMWSVAEHGPTPQMLLTLQPLLTQAGVAAYLSGHDHNTQHLVVDEMSYFVTGNGGRNDPSQAHLPYVPKDSLKFFNYDGGFLALTFADTTFTAEFWAHNGTVTYSYTGTNPRETLGLNNKDRV